MFTVMTLKAANGEKNHETESNVILNYAFQQPLLKAFALQYIRIDYNVKHDNDFGEDRLFVNYTKILNKNYLNLRGNFLSNY